MNSPIRDSMLDSSRSRGRSSNQRVKQRSQHSLIIESVARILDDSALEDRIHKLHDFRTNPPSEVHQNISYQ